MSDSCFAWTPAATRAKADIFLKDVRFVRSTDQNSAGRKPETGRAECNVAGDGPHQFSKSGWCCALLGAPRCSTVQLLRMEHPGTTFKPNSIGSDGGVRTGCGKLHYTSKDPDLSDEIAIQMMCQNLRSRYVDVQECKNITKKTWKICNK